MSEEPSTRKCFADLHQAEAFFQASTNERSANVVRLARHIVAQAGRLEHMRVLDFGGGDGTFMHDVLEQAGIAPKRVSLCVMDLDKSYHSEYASRLEECCASPVRTFVDWPSRERFDVVVASHVLYYVPSMAQWIEAARRILVEGGVAFVIMGRAHSPATDLWPMLFQLVGEPCPYFGWQDFEREMNAALLPFQVESISLRVHFKSTAENRSNFLRFLLGNHYERILPFTQRFFEPFDEDEYVLIDHEDLLYVWQSGAQFAQVG